MPQIPVSWGELYDKVTILKIKLEKLKTKSALKNVKKEYDELIFVSNNNISYNKDAEKLVRDLKKINNKLWNIEDRIRVKERSKVFDKDFIKLAREVYFTNDERARIKRNINMKFGSEIIKEKSYAKY